MVMTWNEARSCNCSLVLLHQSSVAMLRLGYMEEVDELGGLMRGCLCGKLGAGSLPTVEEKSTGCGCWVWTRGVD